MNGRIVGLIGAVLYVAGHVLMNTVPGGGTVEARQFEDFYVTDDRSGLAVAAVFVLTLGVVALLWFFAELRDLVGGPLADLGFAAASMGLGLSVVGAGVMAGPAGVQAFSGSAFVGQPVAHALAQSGYAVTLVGGGLLLGFAVAVAAVAGGRAGLYPHWVAAVGVVAAVLQLGAVIWIPLFAVPIWIVVVALTARWGSAPGLWAPTVRPASPSPR